MDDVAGELVDLPLDVFGLISDKLEFDADRVLAIELFNEVPHGVAELDDVAVFLDGNGQADRRQVARPHHRLRGIDITAADFCDVLQVEEVFAPGKVDYRPA